MVVSFVV
jgi:hypothetical protein